MIRVVGLGAVLLVAGGAVYTSDTARNAAKSAERAAAATQRQDRSGFIAICERGNLVRGFLILSERNARRSERRAGVPVRRRVAEDVFAILDCERTYVNGGEDVPADPQHRERFITWLSRR